MTRLKTMGYDLLITDIDYSEHKNGFLEISPLGQYRKVLLSTHSCKILFNLFIRWEIIDMRDLELAMQRLKYKER